ncbi:calcium-binding protein [Aliishimia ponticola]|uniref:Calcium-binding protein n=1 Tax=Aliishimia ponticola TaxID=2499833 RepID=A0A4S4N836_9RHOB|nr:calcium-binding protein [Aliishimia ponticola]THH34715.1 calcium-binding protein [Aliishimia ponticola]
MPTATATIYTGENFADFTFDALFDGDLEVTSASSTAIELYNTDFPDRSGILRGTGFSLNSDEEPTGGTMTSIEFYDNGGLVATLSGISFSLVAFANGLGTDDGLDPLFDGYDLIQDASNVDLAEADFGDSGMDDTAIAGPGGSFMSLNEGTDTYVGGVGFDQITFHEEDGGNGASVDLAAGTATDTYGNVETISGTIEALRGSTWDDTFYGDSNDNMMRGLEGDDYLDGRDGIDLLRYDRDANYGGFAGVTVNLLSGTATDGFGDSDTILNFENVRGTESNDIITGDSGSNDIRGLGGDDTINPYDNDGAGDLIVAGTGFDTIIYSDNVSGYQEIQYRDIAEGVTITIDGINNTGTVDKGSTGFDTITDVEMPLYAGDTTGGLGINGTNYNDVYNITLASGQWMEFAGGAGNDTFNLLNTQSSRLDYSNASDSVTVNLATGIASDGDGGTDTINGDLWEVRGSDYNDNLIGSSNDESFIARSGDDSINGGGGFDRLRYDRNDYDMVDVDLTAGLATTIWNGTEYIDTIVNIEHVRGSRTGDDILKGLEGAEDRLQGRGGDDTFIATSGADTIEGEDGIDTLDYTDAALASLNVDLEAGSATANWSTDGSFTDSVSSIEIVKGSSASDTLAAAASGSTLYGNDGNDMLVSRAGDDALYGGDGVDEVSYDGASGGVEVYLNSEISRGADGDDELYDIENVQGSDFDDRLVGTAEDNLLVGGTGNDIIKGKGGDDTFYGNAGDDTIRGAEGVDIMYGHRDNDTLLGLEGDDFLYGGNGTDYLYGGLDSDYIDGGANDDFLRGNRGGDTIDGGSGNDDIRGGGNGDILDGGYGDDFILGEGGTDYIAGGAGDDTLFGGVGGGVFDGQRDTFIYASSADGSGGFDRIRDWEDGIDRIDLSAYEFTDFATDVLSLASNAGTAMRINFGGGDVIYIDSFQVTDFDASDVILG